MDERKFPKATEAVSPEPQVLFTDGPLFIFGLVWTLFLTSCQLKPCPTFFMSSVGHSKRDNRLPIPYVILTEAKLFIKNFKKIVMIRSVQRRKTWHIPKWILTSAPDSNVAIYFIFPTEHNFIIMKNIKCITSVLRTSGYMLSFDFFLFTTNKFIYHLNNKNGKFKLFQQKVTFPVKSNL